MLRSQRSSTRQQKSITKTIPAPVGGWNARDPLANMAAIDAVELDNWFPRTADIVIRSGSFDWATVLPDQVNSLLVYNGATSSTLFAASSSGIYNVTETGTVGAAVVTGLTSDKFNYTNIRTAGGSFLWAVNGADLARLYDGTTWSNPSVTGLSGALTTADFSNISIWKRRIFLVQKNSMSVWYLGIDSISGAASEINFGPLFRKGGKIVATANWTLDGGLGMDDHFVIITSMGEVAVYYGTNPASASDFALKGVYELGAPIGDKCCIKVGGELVLMTVDGFVPLSAALASTRVNNKLAISDKIADAVSAAAAAYKGNFGWEPTLFAAESALIFNIPVDEGVESHQYVMNTTTGAWCRFKGWNANAFAVMDDELYFATDTKVCKAWQGIGDSGEAIATLARPAFNYYDSPGVQKHWKMAKPVFTANLKPVASFGLNVDFDDSEITNTTSFAGPDYTWGNALWGQARWSGPKIYKDWQTVFGVGECASLRVETEVLGLEMSWSATLYVFEIGGVV
jgi:hypothetical protein